ncbi:MAG: sodium/solute symporter [Myxococcota bacterium]
MNGTDYTVIVIYLAAMVGLGFALRKQSSERSFFLGDGSLGWFPLALSTMATQLSAISFVSAPAFVGIREGGGLKWLTYEFAVPLAMVFVMFVIAPALYRAKVVSIYEYLQTRFGWSTRMLISLCFQVVRSFSTGIMIYAPALILEAVLQIPTWASILAVGLIALTYSSVGGMEAVVYSDSIQMGLIFVGLLVAGAFALDALGGVEGLMARVDPARLVAVDAGSFGFDGDAFGLLPMVFGGFVLYASYYGCDQTQAQRVLSASSMASARRLLFTNGLLRFPLVLLYCTVGLLVGTALTQFPDSMARIPPDRPDFMMPIFIVDHLPHGVIGLLIVAILSAAMSSVSSGMNSLAAVTLEDLRSVGWGPKSWSGELAYARGLSVAWGVVMVVLSFYAGSIAPTVIEAINKVGSALYGPVLGVFMVGILSSRRSEAAANLGLLSGLALNLYFWLFVPSLFWMWWNFIGLGVTLAVTLLATAMLGPSARADAEGIEPRDRISGSPAFRPLVVVLLGAFVAMVTVSWLIPGAALGRGG